MSPDHLKVFPAATAREAQEFPRDLDKKLWSANGAESRTLTTLCDTLLPKQRSGS
jgi:hypothetical protein